MAWNIACAAAVLYDVQPRHRVSKVLVLEADFRRPSLAVTHGLQARPGLTELIAEDLPLSHAIQRVAVGDHSNGAGHGAHLDVIVAGSLPPNPLAMLESDRTTDPPSMLTGIYELVIIDTPPITVVSSAAVPLLGRVSGVLVVGRVGLTRRDTATRLHKRLASLNAPVLGLVANGVRSPVGGSYGYYGGEDDTRRDRSRRRRDRQALADAEELEREELRR